jgi:SAM-dependent methyltransferase
MNPKDIVEQGYDRIGEEYERWSTKGTDPARERYLKVLFEDLPKGAQVLDLGCGSGALATRRLSERFQITGVELSSRMVELAQRNIPTATFVRADMASVEFPPELFDGVRLLLAHPPAAEGAADPAAKGREVAEAGRVVRRLDGQRRGPGQRGGRVGGRGADVLCRACGADERGAGRRSRAARRQRAYGGSQRSRRGRYLPVDGCEEAEVEVPRRANV